MGFKILFVNSLNNKENFYSLFKEVYKLGYSRIMVEAGLTFLGSLLKDKLIDDFYLFKSDKNLKKNGYNNTSLNIFEMIKFKNVKINLENDKLYRKEF